MRLKPAASAAFCLVFLCGLSARAENLVNGDFEVEIGGKGVKFQLPAHSVAFIKLSK